MPLTYNLDRFLTAQESVYDTALNELRNGKKNLIGCGIFSRR